MVISRSWAMPNKNTFDIPPIKALIEKYINTHPISIDPFANKNRLAKVTNDLDPSYCTDYSMDAINFLKLIKTASVGVTLYDPPYSPRQVSECYTKLGFTVNMQTTQSSFWGNLKKEIGRVTFKGGYCLSFGWNSNGIGKVNGFEIVEVLTVAHGGHHNDTICTVELKTK